MEKPKKSLGQNFLIDPNTIRKIVETQKDSDAFSRLRLPFPSHAGFGAETFGVETVGSQSIAFRRAVSVHFEETRL